MGAPHVAGAWALMKQQDPGATVATILAALQNTGAIIDDQRSSGVVTGMRRIKVDNALGPQLTAATFTLPSGGETLLAGTPTHVSWNTNYAPLLRYDMESGGGSWATSHGAGSLDWVLDTGNPHSGSYAWFASDPAAISDQYLTASIGPLTVPVNGQLSFRHSYITELDHDGGVVEISTDGLTWEDLGPLMTLKGYDTTIATGFGSPIGGRAAFSGNSGGYIETLADLSSYTGQAVHIRFRMTSDSAVSSLGWYVDDVALLESTASQVSYDLAHTENCTSNTSWTPIGTSAAGASNFAWTVPPTVGADHCLRIEGKAPGYINSPQVISAPFSVDLDSDGDRLSDTLETTVLGTNPNNVDSDNDGLVDGSGGVVPLAALPAGIDIDSDGFVDGEQDLGTDPTKSDSDGDGISDGDEIRLYGIDPTLSNLGDIGPRGSPDNVVSLGDLVVLTRLVTGVIQPTAPELILGDINSDAQLNSADILLLQQSILNDTPP